MDATRFFMKLFGQAVEIVRRDWSFPTLAAAEELVARLERTGVIGTGGA